MNRRDFLKLTGLAGGILMGVQGRNLPAAPPCLLSSTETGAGSPPVKTELVQNLSFSFSPSERIRALLKKAGYPEGDGLLNRHGGFIIVGRGVWFDLWNLEHESPFRRVSEPRRCDYMRSGARLYYDPDDKTCFRIRGDAQKPIAEDTIVLVVCDDSTQKCTLYSDGDKPTWLNENSCPGVEFKYNLTFG